MLAVPGRKIEGVTRADNTASWFGAESAERAQKYSL